MTATARPTRTPSAGPRVSAGPRSPAGEFAIETHGLTKAFGRQKAVDGVDLAVPRGTVFGFLGPNGSGKTTTIRMLLGLASASSGDIRLLDGDMPKDARTVLPRVGALVEGPAIYPFLSGRANLQRFDAADRHTSPATRNKRVDAALERVGLGHAARKRAHAYSLGMKQRLGIANALLAPRDLLILDEPTNGLDPQGTREVRNLIRSLSDDGTTVFVSSHLLAEVEQMCTGIAIMSAGRLVAQGTLDELRAEGTAHVRVTTPDHADAHRVLTGLGLTPERHGRDDVLTAELSIPGLLPETVNAALVRADVRVRGFEASGASLEDRFVALTGEGFDIAG